MRRSLLFVLAGLLAVLAQPAMANRMMVRGNVQHHHHVFFRHNHVFFHHHNRIFFSSAINPFFSPTFTLASPFIAQPLPFSSLPGLSSGAFGGGFFGAPVAFGDVGGFPAGGAAVGTTVIVIAMPAANAPPRRPEEARPTVEQTPSGVTIIRGPGSQHY
jgi:hypothetical protein